MAVFSDGSLRVERVEDGGVLVLPPGYVGGSLALAYASTVHAAQGRTVDTCRLLVDENADRATVYVGLSRGRQENIAYVVGEPGELAGDVPVRVAVLGAALDRSETDVSAVAVMRDEFAASESLMRLGAVWRDVCGVLSGAAYDGALRGALTARCYERLVADPASGALYRLLRSVELGGEDVAAVVTRAVGWGELDSAVSVAQVLHYRVECECPRPASASLISFTDRTPVGVGPVAEYASSVAAAMDRRRLALGEALAEDPPVWLAGLGAVPVDLLRRADWVERASYVAAFRDEVGFRSEDDAIGPAPRRGQAEAHAAWTLAYLALGRPESVREVAALSTAELGRVLGRYERDLLLAPACVDDELRGAVLTLRQWREWAAVEIAAASAPGADPASLARVAGCADLLRELEARVARLSLSAGERAAWLARTAQARRDADAALDELARRGVVEPVVERDQAQEDAAAQVLGVAVSAALAGGAVSADELVRRRDRRAHEAARALGVESDGPVLALGKSVVHPESRR